MLARPAQTGSMAEREKLGEIPRCNVGMALRDRLPLGHYATLRRQGAQRGPKRRTEWLGDLSSWQ